MAGALCYFLVMAHAFSDGNKRTGAIAAAAFLAINGFELKLHMNPKKNVNAFAEMALACADGKIVKDEVGRRFDSHKARISNHSPS